LVGLPCASLSGGSAKNALYIREFPSTRSAPAISKTAFPFRLHLYLHGPLQRGTRTVAGSVPADLYPAWAAQGRHISIIIHATKKKGNSGPIFLLNFCYQPKQGIQKTGKRDIL
jgi:hypothetical protein